MLFSIVALVRVFYGRWGLISASKIFLGKIVVSSFRRFVIFVFYVNVEAFQGVLMCVLCFAAVLFALCSGWGLMSVCGLLGVL